MEQEPVVIQIQYNRKKPAKVVLFVMIILLVIYVVIGLFFASHYTYKATVAGKDCSFASKRKVYDSFDGNVKIPIIYHGRQENDVIIVTDEFSYDCTYDLSQIRKDTDLLDGLRWLEYTILGHNLKVYVTIDIERDSFDEVLGLSVLFAKKLQKEPENAFLAGYDEKTREFLIKEGNPGNILDIEKVYQITQLSLVGIEADVSGVVVDLDESDCYKSAAVSTANARLMASKDKADHYLATNVVYDWNGVRVNVDASVIKEWLIIDGFDVFLDEERVADFVENTATLNDTFGKPMRFKTSLGDSVTINRGDYGWKTNVTKETEALINHIYNSDDVITEPIYLYKGYVKGQNDVGRSYIEVDLSNQHVYLYIDGKLKLETDCVTGNMAQGHKTPEGIYGITYKTTNATLRGPGYESFVYYWMPYCGGVGLHDATWRGKFGGEIYKTSGSHGCVNLPLSIAKELYGYVETNFPVVSYW